MKTVQSSKETISFSGKSDVGQATINLEKGGADILELIVNQESKSTYNIDYILGLSKSIGSASDTVVCEYSAKKPIKLTYRLNEQGAEIRYFLAPRIAE